MLHSLKLIFFRLQLNKKSKLRPQEIKNVRLCQNGILLWKNNPLPFRWAFRELRDLAWMVLL